MSTQVKIYFCAGHRIKDADGPESHLHGHSFIALLTAQGIGSEESIQRTVKELVGGWIEAEWDHGFILDVDDTAAYRGLSHFDDLTGVDQKIAFLAEAPTPGNMASHLFSRVCPAELQDSGITVTQVALMAAYEVAALEYLAA